MIPIKTTRPTTPAPLPLVRVALLLVVILSSRLQANPTQEEVFRSINQNVNSPSSEGASLMPFLLGGGALTVMIVIWSQRRQKKVINKSLNHTGKLLKEIRKSIHLKPAELKQIKLLAEEQGLNQPLTLLLCPSVLNKATRSSSARIDRRVLAGVAHRFAANRSADE